MNADDPLLGAFEALRDVHDGKPGGAETRRRVLAGARRRADSRHRLLYVLIPAAATLLVSVAWADGAGRLGPWRAVLRDVLEPSRPVPPPGLPRKVHASGRPPPAVYPADPAPVQPEVRVAMPGEPATFAGPSAPVIPPTELLAPPVPRPPPHAHAPVSVESAPSPRELGDTEDDLFAAAQAAHFGARDAVRALHAWDAYLSAFPHGRFELEARYNRATTLLRLGRDDEARTALRPFVEGPYRSREARLLLQALDEGR